MNKKPIRIRFHRIAEDDPCVRYKPVQGGFHVTMILRSENPNAWKMRKDLP